MSWFMIEDARKAMLASKVGPTDESILIISQLPPIVRLAMEMRLRQAALYASSLPDWVRNAPPPADQTQLDQTLDSINSEIDKLKP